MRQYTDDLEDELAQDLARDSADYRVLIADGYDARIMVRNGSLQIDDGIRPGRRTRKIGRIDGIKRIVILADTGLISLEALRWCESEGIAICQIERDGRIVVTSPGEHPAARIRQAQAIASASGMPHISLEFCRNLLTAKMEGQAAIAEDLLHRPDIADLISERIRMISKAESLKQLSGYEGDSAAAYWKAWIGQVVVPFPPRELASIPAHWINFTGRASGSRSVSSITSKRRNRSSAENEPGNRGATDPINAMLNYAYRVAESEAIHLCHMYGLDPGIGFMHIIESDRQAMALDLIECARPVCDRIVLEILGHEFSYEWAYEIRHGVVRVVAPITQMIAGHCLEMSQAIEPHVRELSSALGRAHIPDLSARLAYGQSMSDVRAANARVATRSAIQRIPAPSNASEVISDKDWAEISKCVPVINNVMGAKRADDRLIIAAIVWCAANGQPHTRLPSAFSLHYKTVRRRISEWESCGAWPRICRAIRKTSLPGFSG